MALKKHYSINEQFTIILLVIRYSLQFSCSSEAVPPKPRSFSATDNHDRISPPPDAIPYQNAKDPEHSLETHPSTHENTVKGGVTHDCKEHQHFYFLKVAKCGSTTLYNIIYRFGVTRGLTFTLFKNKFPFPQHSFRKAMLPAPTNEGFHGKYDIFCEHSIFNPQELNITMKKDTKNIANLRDPLSRLRSNMEDTSYRRKKKAW